MLQLRVATWNIGGGFVAADQPQRFDVEDLAYFAATLQPLARDVVCLQEIHTPITSSQAGQAEQLAHMLQMPYWQAVPYGPNCRSPFRDDQDLSLAILSRWEILTTCYALLPNPHLRAEVASGELWTTHDKGFLSARLDVAGRRVVVLTGHTVPFEIYHREALEDEFAPIRRSMEATILASAARPTIVTGDFNYDDVERLLPRVFQAGYRRVLIGPTEPRYGRQRDHILVSPHWRVERALVLPGRADHYLGYADISLE